MAAVDASADFRHPGNAPSVGAAAGEELALATGRGQRDLTDLEGLRPYLREGDVHLLGIRDGDDERAELTAAGMSVHTVGEIRQRGGRAQAEDALDALGGGGLDGFWVHLDADVLDPSVMPAVDSPDPDGLLPDEVRPLLATLLASEYCVGLNITIYDPDLDPDGTAGTLLADLVVDALAGV
ncbi:Arginase family protein OS=Streptomyces tendae OX=1932 GN=GUR47_24360 PE=3 SV=1 [Streptomyces tendae]